MYVLARMADSPLPRLNAVSRRLPEVVFSGRTAGWLHGLDLPPAEPIEGIVQDTRFSARAGVKLQRTKLNPEDVVRLRGLPVTSALRTSADLGSRKPLVEAVVALDMALHKRIVTFVKLRSFYEANRGVRGASILRRAIDLAEPATQSPMETRLRLLLVTAGLPRPEAQVSLHDQAGRFLGRPDLYYSAQKLGLEYDGATHRDTLVGDNRRQNRLLNAGIRLLRFTAVDIYQAPESVIQQVRRELSR